MATEANLSLRVDTTQAQQNLQKVTDRVIDQEDKIAELGITLVKAEQDLANFNFKGFQGQLKLEKKITDTKQQIELLRKQLVKLKVDQKAEARALRDANKVRTAGTIKAAQFNETLLKNRDITSGLNKLTGGYSLQVQSLGKTFLSLGRGIKIAAGSLSIFSKALIATGIGAIVVAVGLLAANFDKVTKALGGVTKEQEKLLNDAKELVTAQEDQFKNLTSTEETLKRQGKTEKEIRDLKIQQTNETITALEAQLTQQKTIRDEQVNIANRNKAILKGILQFVSAPLMLVLKGIDKAVQFFGGESNLADGFTESVAGLIFDPDKIAEEADKGIEETIKKLRELKNRRDGFLNQAKAEEDAETEKANQKMLNDIKEAVDNEAKRQESILAVREKYANAWSGICLVSSQGELYSDLHEGYSSASDTSELMKICPYHYEMISNLGGEGLRARIMRNAPRESLLWHSHVLEHGQAEWQLTCQVPIIMPDNFEYCVVHKDDFKPSKRFYKPEQFKKIWRKKLR